MCTMPSPATVNGGSQGRTSSPPQQEAAGRDGAGHGPIGPEVENEAIARRQGHLVARAGDREGRHRRRLEVHAKRNETHRDDRRTRYEHERDLVPAHALAAVGAPFVPGLVEAIASRTRRAEVIGVGVVRGQIPAAHPLDLGAHLPLQRQEVHLEVAAKRPEWVLERRGPVLLEDEVPDPGRAVADDRGEEQPPRVQRERRSGHGAKDGGRSHVVEGAASRVAVRVNVMRPEIVE